jgi:outer membrane protein TolC
MFKVGSLAFSVMLLAALPRSDAQAPEPIPAPVKAPAPAQSTKIDLPTCRRIGMENQPAIAAARASVAAAQARFNGLENLRLAGLLRHDLSIRRQQACLGVKVAQAQLITAEHETLYAVTRTYIGALYAQTQLRVADRALEDPEKSPDSLRFLRKLAMQIRSDATRKDVKAYHVDQLDAYIHVALGKRQEALEGLERARTGLREAMGVCADYPLDLVDTDLPQIDLTVTLDQVIGLAQSRRGELVQAGLAWEITSYEAKAQETSNKPKMETFAAGSDVHATPVPQGMRDGEYRPGAVGLEMPTVMVGKKDERVQQANALTGRAAAVAVKTRNLVTLESKATFLQWQMESTRSPDFRKGQELGRKVYDSIRKAFDPNDKEGGKPTLEDILASAVQASQFEVQANFARYRYLLALAALERVTAGGIDPGFDEPFPKPVNNGGK